MFHLIRLLVLTKIITVMDLEIFHSNLLAIKEFLFASWPSVRPWYFSNPEPTFRCIADVDVIALKLSEAAQSRVSEVNLKKTNEIKNVKMQDGGITA
jgi:hypothetical protein